MLRSKRSLVDRLAERTSGLTGDLVDELVIVLGREEVEALDRAIRDQPAADRSLSPNAA